MFRRLRSASKLSLSHYEDIMRRSVTGFRSGSLVHELYIELVSRGVCKNEASRQVADAFGAIGPAPSQ